MLLISIYGYIIPNKYENSHTQGITRIISASMEPDFKVGEGIIYDKVDISSVQLDDPIVYYFTDNDNNIIANIKVLHRVTKIIKDENGNVNLVTKADNNIEIDKNYVTSKNFLGVYNHKTSWITNLFLKDNFKISTVVFIFLIIEIFGIIYLDVLQINKMFLSK